MSDTNFEGLLAAARLIYEGTHGLTIDELANITGIAKRTLKIYQRDQSWQKRLETKNGGSTAEADEARKVFEGGAAALAAMQAETVSEAGELTQPLPSAREALLERHKKELNVSRGLLQQALNLNGQGNGMRAFETAKLAKISAETLTLVHNAERKAHGIDKGDGDHTVIIDRGAPA